MCKTSRKCIIEVFKIDRDFSSPTIFFFLLRSFFIFRIIGKVFVPFTVFVLTQLSRKSNFIISGKFKRMKISFVRDLVMKTRLYGFQALDLIVRELKIN